MCSHDWLMPSVHATVNIMPPVLQVLGLAATAEPCIFRQREQWRLYAVPRLCHTGIVAPACNVKPPEPYNGRQSSRQTQRSKSLWNTSIIALYCGIMNTTITRSEPK